VGINLIKRYKFIRMMLLCEHFCTNSDELQAMLDIAYIKEYIYHMRVTTNFIRKGISSVGLF